MLARRERRSNTFAMSGVRETVLVGLRPLQRASSWAWMPTEAGRILLQCEVQASEGPAAVVTYGVSVRNPANRRYLDNRSPVLSTPKCDHTRPGTLTCSVAVTDPDGDRVSVDWVSTGGDTRSGLSIELPVLSATADGGLVEVVVLVHASDRKGGEANASLRVNVPTFALAAVASGDRERQDNLLGVLERIARWPKVTMSFVLGRMQRQRRSRNVTSRSGLRVLRRGAGSTSANRRTGIAAWLIPN